MEQSPRYSKSRTSISRRRRWVLHVQTFPRRFIKPAMKAVAAPGEIEIFASALGNQTQ
jgi:hypothetical protein